MSTGQEGESLRTRLSDLSIWEKAIWEFSTRVEARAAVPAGAESIRLIPSRTQPLY